MQRMAQLCCFSMLVPFPLHRQYLLLHILISRQVDAVGTLGSDKVSDDIRHEPNHILNVSLCSRKSSILQVEESPNIGVKHVNVLYQHDTHVQECRLNLPNYSVGCNSEYRHSFSIQQA